MISLFVNYNTFLTSQASSSSIDKEGSRTPYVFLLLLEFYPMVKIDYSFLSFSESDD